MPLSEEHKKRRARNVAIATGLAVLVILFFIATIVKVQEAANAGL